MTPEEAQALYVAEVRAGWALNIKRFMRPDGTIRSWSAGLNGPVPPDLLS